ncbi:MAG: cell wall-binding repeat-containing protein [Actinobacteria bacterium]|nr:cell wall-binding repeat-containing protein [Actinomycetota bacterium]
MRTLPHLFRTAVALVLALFLTTPAVGAQETTTTSSPTSTTTTTTTTTTSEAGAQDEDSYTEAIDITFPTSPSVQFTDDYHQPRSGGRVHRATDLMGPKGTKLYAARAGTVCFITGYDKLPPSYGVMLTICGDDGRKYDYIHVNNDTPGTDDAQGGPEFAFSPGLHPGGAVSRGQWIATMGDSGNAEGTAPHLHFEIEDPTILDPYGTNQRNPYNSLTAALERHDVPTEPGPPGLDAVVRVGGVDRVATAIALAARWQQAPSVVLASGDRVPDSLAAGPLAASAKGPVLLNLGSRLDPRVASELKRLRPAWVVLVGGPAALSHQTDADVRSTVPGARVDRIFGPDRFATAAAVSRTIWASAPGTRSAVIALGDHADPARAWPDALTAGWLGALTHRPVLLTAPDRVPQATLDALEGIGSAVVVGGEAPVPPAVFSRLDQAVGTLTRLAGVDRYATAIRVAEAGLRAGATLTHLRVVTGRGPGDALAAGAAAADEEALMILVDGLEQRADLPVSYYLRPRSAQIQTAAAIGGPQVMTDEAIARLGLRIT